MTPASNDLCEELRILSRTTVTVRVDHDVWKAELGCGTDETDDLGMKRRLSTVVELDGTDADVGAFLDEPIVERRIHVTTDVGVVAESLCANVLVRPDLAEPLGIFFGATATKVTDRDRLEIHMDRMIALVQLLASTIPLLSIGLVALTPAGVSPSTRNVGSLLIRLHSNEKLPAVR